MNRCQFMKHLTKRTYAIRSYSAINKTSYILSCDDDRLLNPYKSPLCSSKRMLSFQGFSEWQAQTYSSISNSSLVGLMQDGLLTIHDTTGLPWWATIICSTALLRGFITFPLSVYQNFILAKVEMVALEARSMLGALQKEVAIAKETLQLSDKQAAILFKRSHKKHWKALIIRDNCHPFKSTLVIWLQIPMWICMSFALRNLVNMQPMADAAALVTLAEFTVGGFGWIPNLAVPDHSWVLPITLGLTNLAIIELQSMSKLRRPSKLYNIFTNVFRGFSLVIIPVAASVPSCMCLYWTVSSGIGLAQNVILLSPSLRRKLKIPITPSEHERPYQFIAQEIKGKLDFIMPSKT